MRERENEKRREPRKKKKTGEVEASLDLFLPLFPKEGIRKSKGNEGQIDKNVAYKYHRCCFGMRCVLSVMIVLEDWSDRQCL